MPVVRTSTLLSPRFIQYSKKKTKHIKQAFRSLILFLFFLHIMATQNTSATTNSNTVLYGQVVVGPPGAGKTTYCDGMQQYLRLLHRNAWVMNMDPANDPSSYETIFDVRQDMVDLAVVMDELELGPNGGLLYCMEYMEAHVTEIVQHVRNKQQHDNSNTQEPLYLLLDFPGQVELYTHSTCVQSLLAKLQKQLNLRLTMVQLIDSQYCYQASSFLSAALLGTTTLLRMELPTVSVWTKIDLLRGNDLPMPFEFFVECYDLERLLPFLDQTHSNYDDNPDDEVWDDPDYRAARQRRKRSKWFQKYTKLHQIMAEVVQDFGLLGFIPLDVQDATLVGRVLAKVDQCNGYVWTQQSIPEDLFQCAAASSDYTGEAQLQIRERIHSSQSSNQEI